MAKYLTKFTDQAAYEAGEKQYPNVSLLDNGDVKYMAVKPPYQGKALLTYNDGTEYEIVCNTSTTLTTEETKSVPKHSHSGITRVEIGTCTTTIGREAFSQCKNIETIIIPSTVVTIDYAAFDYASIGSISIPDSVNLIGGRAFYGCNLPEVVTIPNSVLTFSGDQTFRYATGVKTLILPENITTLPRLFLADCRTIESVVLPTGLTTINDWAFGNCQNITGLTIPSTIESIGAFNFNTTYSSITCLATTPPTLGASSLNQMIMIFVPAESVSAYRQAPNWSNYASRIQAIQ